VNVLVGEQVWEVVVDAWHEFRLLWAWIDDTVAAAVVDDLLWAHACVSAGVWQASTAVLAWIRCAEVDHFLAQLTSVAGFALAFVL